MCFEWIFPLMSLWHMATPPRPPPLLLLVERSVSCRSRNARASPRISRSRWQPPSVGATRLVKLVSFGAVSQPPAHTAVKGADSHRSPWAQCCEGALGGLLSAVFMQVERDMSVRKGLVSSHARGRFTCVIELSTYKNKALFWLRL